MESLRAPRVPFDRPVCIGPLGEAPRRFTAGDLSAGGMFVRCERGFSAATRVSVALEAYGRPLPFAEGEVVWERTADASHAAGTAGFAVRFTHLSPRAAALVEHLVSRGGTAAPAPTVARSRRRLAMRATLLVVPFAIAAALVLLHRPPTSTRTVPLTAPATVALPRAATAPTRAPAGPSALDIALPSGGVRSVHLAVRDGQLAVTPTLRNFSTLQRVFQLSSPARLVIDVEGRIPRAPLKIAAPALVEAVRVGRRLHGTRVVIDLKPPLQRIARQ